MQRSAAETEWSSRTWARIAGVVGVCAVTMMLLDRSTACARMLAPACVFTARSVEQVLNSMGMDCRRNAATLTHPGGFGYEIGFACTGVIPSALLAATILVAEGRLRARFWGATLAALSVLLVNLVRLLSLFYVGVFAPRFFTALHTFVWQALTVVFVTGLFYIWKRKSALRLTARINGASD